MASLQNLVGTLITHRGSEGEFRILGLKLAMLLEIDVGVAVQECISSALSCNVKSYQQSTEVMYCLHLLTRNRNSLRLKFNPRSNLRVLGAGVRDEVETMGNGVVAQRMGEHVGGTTSSRVAVSGETDIESNVSHRGSKKMLPISLENIKVNTIGTPKGVNNNISRARERKDNAEQISENDSLAPGIPDSPKSFQDPSEFAFLLNQVVSYLVHPRLRVQENAWRCLEILLTYTDYCDYVVMSGVSPRVASDAKKKVAFLEDLLRKALRRLVEPPPSNENYDGMYSACIHFLSVVVPHVARCMKQQPQRSADALNLTVDMRSVFSDEKIIAFFERLPHFLKSNDRNLHMQVIFLLEIFVDIRNVPKEIAKTVYSNLVQYNIWSAIVRAWRFDDCASDRALYDSVKISGEAVLLVSIISGFWDSQILSYICASTNFLDSYSRVLDAVVTQLRDQVEAYTLEKHLVSIERFAICVGTQIHSGHGSLSTKQNDEVLEFFASRSVAELCAISMSDSKPMYLRRRAMECVHALSGLASESPLSIPHPDHIQSITKCLVSLYLMASGTYCGLNSSDDEFLSAHNSLCHLILANPAAVTDTIRAVQFVPKLVRLIESCSGDIKIANILRNASIKDGIYCAK